MPSIREAKSKVEHSSPLHVSLDVASALCGWPVLLALWAWVLLLALCPCRVCLPFWCLFAGLDWITITHSSMSRSIRPVGPIPQRCRHLLVMPYRRGPVGAADAAGSPQLVSPFCLGEPSSFLPGLCMGMLCYRCITA